MTHVSIEEGVWCGSAFHPSRWAFQYGRSRTLASRSYASRASANDAFAPVSARGKLPDSNRFSNTPDRRFYMFRDPFCNNVLVDSYNFPDKNAVCNFAFT